MDYRAEVPQKTISVGRTWLDQLPTEVCNLIATFATAHIHGGRRFVSAYFETAYQLAKVSETQRAAVKYSFADKFNFRDFDDFCIDFYPRGQRPADVIAVLMDDVREISGSACWFYNDFIRPCFRSPSLVKLSMFDIPPNFNDYLHAKNLRSLSLEFRNVVGGKPLLQSLSVPGVRELELIFAGSLCFHDEFAKHPEDHSLLATWFPRVEKLTAICRFCDGWTEPECYLWRCIEHFPVLKEVTIPEVVPAEAIQRIRQMDRVSLRDGAIFQLAEVIPDRVVRIEIDDFWNSCSSGRQVMRGSQLEQLAHCKRLEQLECCIERGAEYALPQVMGNLRSFGLGFEDEKSGEWNRGHICLPYEPEEGVLLEAVKSAPLLKSVKFINTLFKPKEVRDILVVLGDRIQDFELNLFSHCGNDRFEYDMAETRHEMEELIAVLRTAGLHNPSLRRFVLDVESTWYTDKEAVSPLLLKLEAALGVLQRHAPLLDTGWCTSLLGNLQFECARADSSSENEDNA